MRKQISVQAAKQAGFTLIELIVVIVIIGILAAVAIPKYQDLTGDAKKGVSNSVAGSVVSAAAINFARYQANSTAAGVVDVSSCATVPSDWVTGTTYTLATATGTAPTGFVYCTVTVDSVASDKVAIKTTSTATP